MEYKEKIRNKVDEIIEEILFTPAKRKLLSNNKEFKENFKRINHTTDIKDNLDTIRVHIQYLLFDIDATRRENTMLRNMLRKKNGGFSPPEND